MKRPKLKKASKRISCSVKYKIQKKVREHHKKLRKEAKKKGVNTRPKKDLGVPNIAPFKEEVLREAEQRRLKVEEEKEKKKQAKKDKRKENKRKGPEAKDAPVAKKARTEEKNEKKKYKKIADKSSKKSLCTELNKVIDASDVILEVLDARDPMGYRCPQLEEAVLQRDGNKKLLFVLTKIDLVPKENLEKWIQVLQQEFPVLAFKAAIQLQDRTVNERKNRVMAANGVFDKSRAAACLGNEVLLELLEGYRATLEKEKEDMLKVGVVGFPNVGKSSLVNSLKGLRACNAGVQRGLTKIMQDVHISKSVKLLDSPGIVASPSNPPVSMALRSLQVEDGGQGAVLEAVRTLLKQCDQNQIILQYNIADYRNHLEFLSLFAKKRGFLQKGGVVNMEQAAAAFLNDWTGAKLNYHCKAPETCSPAPYLSEAVVAEMQKGWDLDRLKKANEETLRGVRCPNKSSSILFATKGPSAGLLSVADIPEDKPVCIPTEEHEDSGLKNGDQSEMKNEGLEDITEQPEEEEHAEELQQTSVKDEPATVKVDPAPVEASLPRVPTATTDDVYDFSTDFK